MKPFPVGWLQGGDVPCEVWLAWGDGRFVGVFPTMLAAHERVRQEADNGRVLRYKLDRKMLMKGERCAGGGLKDWWLRWLP